MRIILPLALLVIALAGCGSGHAATRSLSDNERAESFCGDLFDELRAIREHTAFPGPVIRTISPRERKRSLKRGAEQAAYVLRGIPKRIDALKLPSSYQSRQAKFVQSVDSAAGAFSELAGEVSTRFSGTASAGLHEEERYLLLERPLFVACARLSG